MPPLPERRRDRSRPFPARTRRRCCQSRAPALGGIPHLRPQTPTFALESTLSGRTYIRLLRDAKSNGYRIELHYLWLAKPTQAIARVRERVRKGGHAVPVADIRRRFRRSLERLVADYLPLADDWQVCDNSGSQAHVLATSRNHVIQDVKRLIQP